MATAGMGDVLTGVIAGVLAQQSDPRGYLFNAVAASVQVHASAGDSAAYATAYAGERGLMARDVLAELRPWVNP
jgi:NAD(P)H-hydrate epimerase